MHNPRATLIQHASEFVLGLRPYLQPLLEAYQSFGITEESTLTWVVAEEFELIYGLFDETHQQLRWLHHYQVIYSQLRAALPFSLSVYTEHYLKAPRIYRDSNMIELRFTQHDLHTHYDAGDLTCPFVLFFLNKP